MLPYDLASLGRMAGHDGASTQVWPAPRPADAAGDEDADEVQHLYRAWEIERARAVELEFLLTRVRKLLGRSLAPGGGPSPAALRKARRLLGDVDRPGGPGRPA